jgi:Ca2+/H+ antiporter
MGWNQVNSPSPSTVASIALGVPVATIVSWLLNTFLTVVVPGPVEAAMGVVIGQLMGYFFLGGRKNDVE